MRRIINYIFILFFLFPKLVSGQDFSIAAAADLRYALNELVMRYKAEKHYSGNISIIFGSSGSLYQQISNQAPFDLFFSADNAFPQRLADEQKTIGRPVRYAIGHLVLWSSSKDITDGISILGNTTITKIAIANPEVAPYGKRAMECIRYYKLFEKVKDKLVKGENVSQAAQFVLTGNADVGLIALSLAISPEMASKGKYFMLDENSYTPLEQSFVITKQADQKPYVQVFAEYLSSKSAREIFIKYGFKLPKEK